VTGLRRLGQRAFTCLSFALACAVASLTPFFVPSAAATAPSCGSAGVTIAPLHGTRFYVDSSASPVLDSGYTGFSVSPATAKTNLWVQLSGFTGGALGLNANQPSAFPVGNVGAGSTTPAYFFLSAAPVAQTATAQNFSVNVWQGDPSHGGTQLCTVSDGYSAGIYDTIQASANKVQDVTGDSVAATVSTSSPVIGGAITLSVEGTTGTLGNGPDGTPFIYETPTSLGSWPAGSFRLTGTTLTLNPGSSQSVYTNQLQLSNAAWSAAQSYIAQYTFQITGTTAAATTPYPIQEISSGTQVKHTNTSSLSAIPAIQPASNTMTVSGTGSPSSLPSTGGTVTYTVKLHSTTSTSTSVDEVVDTLPASVAYQAGTAKVDGSTVADPTSSAGTLVFPGPFTLSSAADRTLTFDATLPATAGTYTNSVVGYVASTQLDTTTDTSDSAPATSSTDVAGAAQTISFAQPADTRIDQGPVALTATASSGLAVGIASNSTSVCTVSGATATLLAAGTCSITASQSGNGTYAAATPVTRTFQVTAAPLAQTIAFAQPADTRLDQGPVSLAASASSGLGVVFASNSSSICTDAGASVTLVAVGTCSLTASQGGDGTYAAASSVTRTFQVTAVPLSQTITFAQPADTRLDQGPVSLTATASSSLVVTFTSNDTTVCTLSGSSVTLVATGTCSISAAQAGDGTYLAAPSVTRTFQVTAAPQLQAITFSQPADTRVDEGPVSLSASSSSGLAVTFTSNDTSVCTVSGSSVTLVATGTCSVTASQSGNGTFAAALPVTRTFQVTSAPVSLQTQTIAFAQPADTRADQGPVTVTASATSGLPVVFSSATSSVCTVSGVSVTLISTGVCSITASQAGDATYGGAPDVTRSFQVTAALVSQTITFAQPSDTQIDLGPVALSAAASSGLAVTLSSNSSSVCVVAGTSVSLVATGACSITATQAGDGTYAAAAAVTRAFQVTAAPLAQTITFSQPADTRVDQGPASLSASASSGLGVTLVSNTLAICTVSGASVTLVATGTCSITASQPGDGTHSAATDVTRTFQVRAAPVSSLAQSIAFVQPGDTRIDQGPVTLSAAASSALSVSFASATPGVCTITGATVALAAVGTCSVAASQAGNGTYAAAADVTRSFQVTAIPSPPGPGAQSIAFAQPSDARVDQGPVALAGTASSGLTVSFSSSTPGVCTVTGSAVALLTTGTCTITASQAGDSNYSAAADVQRAFAITPVLAPGTQSISFPRPADTSITAGPVSLGATATSGLAVGYSSATPAVCTVAGSSVTLATTGTCTIVATQPGDSTYSAAADVTRSFEVTVVSPPLAPALPAQAPAPQKSPQQIALPAVTSPVAPGDSIKMAASTTSGMPVVYGSDTPAVCTVDGDGVVTVRSSGTCTIVAGQPGDLEWYAAPDARVSFGVTAPPLPAPTSSAPTTVAGTTTQSVLAGIPAGATVLLNGGASSVPGVSAVRVEGTRVVVTPTNAFSGIVHVPIVVVSGGQRVETTVDVVVRPKAPTEIAVTPTASASTRIAWKESASATGYVVRVDGRVVCRTSATSCTVPALLAPNQHVVIASTGNLGTVSDDAPAAYVPGKPVLIAIVHFGTASSRLREDARAKLDATEAKIAKGGFTQAMLTCHTDNSGSLVYNMALSHARCKAVAGYVRRQLGISHVTYRQASFAFLHPAAPNTTPAGKARNRRVEVYVR
jgi:outer membrane protein OmpA-like peptidoglycan-associated protein